MKLIVRVASPRRAFVYPIPPAPPTAVLTPWFRSHGAVRVFARGWGLDAAAYRPAALAATWEQFDCLPALAFPLTHAVIVLASPTDVLLSLQQRKRLWSIFRVPIFEQIVRKNGVLLAAECEAHCGLHIESPNFDPGGRPMDSTPCGCGRKSPRLKAAIEAQEISAAAIAR